MKLIKNITWPMVKPIVDEWNCFRAKYETVGHQDVVTVSYKGYKAKMFDTPLRRELRGIVFNRETGKCICRPFHKFFNIGEKPFTNPDRIKWDNAKISVKYDGSIAEPVLIGGKLYWKSMSGFYTDTAMEISKVFERSKMKEFEWAIIGSLRMGFTEVYEYVGPDNCHVVGYDKPELVHLVTRVIETGEYLVDSHKFNPINKAPDIKELKNQEHIEGYVVWDGKDFYKLKTNWYMELFHTVMSPTVKDMIWNCIHGKADDIISHLIVNGFNQRAEDVKVMRDLVSSIRMSFKSAIDAFMAKFKYDGSFSRKEFALAAKECLVPELIPVAFLRLDGSPKGSNVLNKAIFKAARRHY